MARLAADPAEPVLLIAYDAPYPEPLNATRPMPDAFAVALALASPQKATRGATITLEFGGIESDVLDDPRLEHLRRVHSRRAVAAAALPARPARKPAAQRSTISKACLLTVRRS